MDVWSHLPCQSGWLPTNHILFHFANVCLFLSFCTPPGLHGLLFLRIVLLLACLFFSLWGWMVLCAMDTFVWNAIFTLMNAVQTYLAYAMLPRKIRFPTVIEHLYEKLLAPLKVSKEEFEAVYNSARQVVYFRADEPFEVSYLVNTVCLVVRGRIAAVGDKKPVKEFYQFEFINPSTYFAAQTPAAHDDLSSLRLVAMDNETVVIIWNCDELRAALERDPHHKLVFDSLASRQLVEQHLSQRTQPSPVSVIPMYPMVKAAEEDARSEAESIPQPADNEFNV